MNEFVAYVGARPLFFAALAALPLTIIGASLAWFAGKPVRSGIWSAFIVALLATMVVAP